METMEPLSFEDSMSKGKGKASSFLAAALELEDRMSEETYGVYLSREVWPAALGEESFRAIQEFLNTLIEDTKRHKEAFLHLKDTMVENTHEN